MTHYRRFNREYAYAGTKEAKQLGMRMMWGGSEPAAPTYYAPPAAPAAPTTGQSMAEYAAAMPAVYEAQLQYQPAYAGQRGSDQIRRRP